MKRHFSILVGALLGLNLAAAADDKPPEQAALAAVKKKLAGTKGGELLTLQPLTGAALERVFPGQRFVIGYVRQFPVGRALPRDAEVKYRNLFIVQDDRVAMFTDGNALRKHLKEKLAAARNDDAMKDIARAYLLLSQAFLQDGFYKFALSDDSFKVTPDKEGKEVRGQMVVMQGGSGTVDARVQFDAAGKVASLEYVSKVKPGPRPICQATKLLDADPVVRKMAEQDLLIMGRAARPYLLEQRARARPELQKAIDRLWQRILREEPE